MTTSVRRSVEIRNLLEFGTSSVGIITAVGRHAVNVMSAEWTYLVARRPPHFAVGCQITNYTTRLILDRGEFGLTLCDASMASLANFAGTYSGADIDKSRISGVRLRDPVVTRTPTVAAGSLSAECRVLSVVDLPDYALIVGEALWVTTDNVANKDPLVKHGRMYRLGEEIRSMAVTASATRVSDNSVRICASAQGVDPQQDMPWTVTSPSRAGKPDQLLHTRSDGADLDVVVQVPRRPLPGDVLVVARPDCRPATVALPTT
ncbi:MAG: flavin reductase family protein [Pseudonocardiaceae bacterium]